MLTSTVYRSKELVIFHANTNLDFESASHALVLLTTFFLQSMANRMLACPPNFQP
jgi:hypothetical protein